MLEKYSKLALMEAQELLQALMENYFKYWLVMYGHFSILWANFDIYLAILRAPRITKCAMERVSLALSAKTKFGGPSHFTLDFDIYLLFGDIACTPDHKMC